MKKLTNEDKAFIILAYRWDLDEIKEEDKEEVKERLSHKMILLDLNLRTLGSELKRLFKFL